MALANYDDLKASIADFLNRDDLTAVIPDFITMAEADMNRKVRHWRMENRASATVNTQYSAIPTDFLEPIRLHLETGDYQPLELLSQQEMQARRKGNLNTSGKPAFYAFTQGEIELYPSPDGDYGLEMNYYQKIPALSSSQTNNWLLTNFPDAYLYGSLVHSAPYLAEDVRVAAWSTFYQNALGSIMAESDQAKFGGSGRRMKIRAY